MLSLCILLEWRLSRKSSASIIAFIAALLFVSMTTVFPAEARRGFGGHVGGHHVGRNVGHYAHRNVGHYAGKDVGHYARGYDHGYRYGRYYRGPGRWVNGLWVATGVAAGAVTNNCNYYHRQWKATGNGYWRDRYANCIYYFLGGPELERHLVGSADLVVLDQSRDASKRLQCSAITS